MPSDATARSVSEALSRLRRLPDTPDLPSDREWVFILQADIDPPCVWIGKTRSLLRKRVCLAQASCPVPLRLVTVVSAPAGTCELIRARFLTLRMHGEWFALGHQLAEFIQALPKGEPLPPVMIQRWAAQLRPA